MKPVKPVTLRDSTYKCMPLRIVKKTVQVPLYSYDYQVQVPVEQKRCNKCLVGLIAQPDRVVMPAPSCREPSPTVPSRGPVFEALSNVEDEDYLYEYPVKKCSCGRYNKKFNMLKFHTNRCNVPKIDSRYHDGYRELTKQEIEDNINRNIKDIFFEDTFQGRMRRLFFLGLNSLQQHKAEEPKYMNIGNFSVGFGKINFSPPPRKTLGSCSEILQRAKRSASNFAESKIKGKRAKRTLLPFLDPQRFAFNRFTMDTAPSKAEDAASVSTISTKRHKRSLDDLTFSFEEDNEISNGHDESYEDLSSEDTLDTVDHPEHEIVSVPKASTLLLDTLHIDQLLPQIPLLFFVNAPISMLAKFHNFNKHFEPVIQSVPTVIRTSGKYFTDFGKKFKRSFYVFTNCLMSSMDQLGHRMKRSSSYSKSLQDFEVVKCTINQDGSVDFILFNHKSDTKLKNIALVIENFTMDAKEAEDVKMYLAKVDTTSLTDKPEKPNGKTRRKRDIFEVDLSGDIKDLINERWGHLMEEQQHYPSTHQSAEVIFEDHFNQIPKLYDAVKKNTHKTKTTHLKKKSSGPKIRTDPILGAVHSVSKKKHEDFADLHPEKNLDIIKQEISNVLGRLQNLLHTDIDKELTFYEDLVKLQYLKNTLISDWRKHLTGDKGQIVSAKMNILNYIKELEKFRASLLKKNLRLLSSQDGDAYNRSDLIKFLVELYKLQMIFSRVHEDLNDKIRLGSKFNQQNEDTYIKQLERIKFLEKTNKFELENRLKGIRDTQVEHNMIFLEKLRKLLELDASVEMEHDDRDEVHNIARMIKENAHYKWQQVKLTREIISMVKLKQTYRKELKNLWDLERHILENDDLLMKKAEKETVVSLEEEKSEEIEKFESKEDNSLETFDILKMAKPITLKPLELNNLKPNLDWEKNIKIKMDEFVKDIADKRKAWVKKTKKLAEIMKEP